MSEPYRILLVSHGYPPREMAGTEQHTHQLATELRARGHAVHVLAATRAPGRAQYSVIKEADTTRIVNNIASRALASGESDAAIDAIATRVEKEFRPDLIHIHHIQFLSSSMRFQAPVVITLHDRWAWCASGGLGIKSDGSVCSGPSESACPPCHAAWRPSPSATAQVLTRLAGWMAPVIAPERLHRWYQHLPGWIRPSPIRDDSPIEAGAAATARNRAVGTFFQDAQARIAPSEHLARQAEAQGVGAVHFIPHGVPDDFFEKSQPSPRTGPFVHLGTVAHHKGTDRVIQAWRAACPDGTPPLLVHGNVLDSAVALGHPIGPPLSRAEVRSALATARALVLGARWPENAPLIILEARAMGCPVIAPAVGGIPEILEDGRDGILVPAHDDTALTEAIRRVAGKALATPEPPPSLRVAVDQIEAVYRSVLRSSADRASG